MSSPTQHTLAWLRKNGYTCQIVETFNHFSMRRNDLFGFVDVLAMKPGQNGVTGIQTTSTGNITARIKKALALPELDTFLACGNRVLFQGWAKRGKAGKVKHWTLDMREVTIDRSVVPVEY